ncbi:MAG: hypothetical protein WCK38_02035, partial [Candidatus Omnitrophota bacterium]
LDMLKEFADTSSPEYSKEYAAARSAIDTLAFRYYAVNEVLTWSQKEYEEVVKAEAAQLEAEKGKAPAAKPAPEAKARDIRSTDLGFRTYWLGVIKALPIEADGKMTDAQIEALVTTVDEMLRDWDARKMSDIPPQEYASPDQTAQRGVYNAKDSVMFFLSGAHSLNIPKNIEGIREFVVERNDPVFWNMIEEIFKVRVEVGSGFYNALSPDQMKTYMAIGKVTFGGSRDLRVAKAGIKDLYDAAKGLSKPATQQPSASVASVVAPVSEEAVVVTELSDAEMIANTQKALAGGSQLPGGISRAEYDRMVEDVKTKLRKYIKEVPAVMIVDSKGQFGRCKLSKGNYDVLLVQVNSQIGEEKYIHEALHYWMVKLVRRNVLYVSPANAREIAEESTAKEIFIRLMTDRVMDAKKSDADHLSFETPEAAIKRIINAEIKDKPALKKYFGILKRGKDANEVREKISKAVVRFYEDTVLETVTYTLAERLNQYTTAALGYMTLFTYNDPSLVSEEDRATISSSMETVKNMLEYIAKLGTVVPQTRQVVEGGYILPDGIEIVPQEVEQLHSFTYIAKLNTYSIDPVSMNKVAGKISGSLKRLLELINRSAEFAENRDYNSAMPLLNEFISEHRKTIEALAYRTKTIEDILAESVEAQAAAAKLVAPVAPQTSTAQEKGKLWQHPVTWLIMAAEAFGIYFAAAAIVIATFAYLTGYNISEHKITFRLKNMLSPGSLIQGVIQTAANNGSYFAHLFAKSLAEKEIATGIKHTRPIISHHTAGILEFGSGAEVSVVKLADLKAYTKRLRDRGLAPVGIFNTAPYDYVGPDKIREQVSIASGSKEDMIDFDNNRPDVRGVQAFFVIDNDGKAYITKAAESKYNELKSTGFRTLIQAGPFLKEGGVLAKKIADQSTSRVYAGVKADGSVKMMTVGRWITRYGNQKQVLEDFFGDCTDVISMDAGKANCSQTFREGMLNDEDYRYLNITEDEVWEQVRVMVVSAPISEIQARAPPRAKIVAPAVFSRHITPVAILMFLGSVIAAFAGTKATGPVAAVQAGTHYGLIAAVIVIAGITASVIYLKRQASNKKYALEKAKAAKAKEEELLQRVAAQKAG